MAVFLDALLSSDKFSCVGLYLLFMLLSLKMKANVQKITHSGLVDSFYRFQKQINQQLHDRQTRSHTQAAASSEGSD